MHKIVLVLAIGIFALFTTGCSLFEEKSQQPIILQPIIYVVSTPSQGAMDSSGQILSQSTSLTFEVANDGSDASWLEQSSERRTQLNRIRYEDSEEDMDEIREDVSRSRNWRTVVDGEELRGYDVIKESKGEIGEYPEDEESDGVYNYVVRFKR